MQHSVALPQKVHNELVHHLVRDDGQEDLCFALWNPSQGLSRTTALVSKVLLPNSGERRVHGNASFLPLYVERVIGEALATQCGIAFLHSHPAEGWQGMSEDDTAAERGLAAKAFAVTGLPLVGLTLGAEDQSWSARFWERTAPARFNREWCTHVRVVGPQLGVTFAEQLIPPPPVIEEQIRTVAAWGERNQATLARLRFGIVGAGSVGSIVAEALARTGVAEISLIDFDMVKLHNLDRLLHANRLDARLSKSKVRTLARGIRQSATARNFKVNTFQYSLNEQTGFRAALDCDILFSCVDRPWPRSILNFVAFAHLIPVVDGGIRIDVRTNGNLIAADWKMHIASPERRCLECMKQYDPAMVSLEREGYLDDPKYIQGLDPNEPFLRNENVFAFSANLASFEVLQMLMMVIAPRKFCDAGEQMYHFVPGIFDHPQFLSCNPQCPYPQLLAVGDSSTYTVTGRNVLAEKMRSHKPQLTFRDRILDLLRSAVEFYA